MSSPPLRRSARILAVNSLLIALFLLHNNIDVPSSIDANAEAAAPRTPVAAVAFSRSSSSLSSGVGLVTTDGAWEELEEKEIIMIDGERGGDISDIKILGFTDRNYLPIAMLWYGRLTVLVRVYSKCKQSCIVTSFLTSLICTFLHISHVQGYTEHYIVAHDE